MSQLNSNALKGHNLFFYSILDYRSWTPFTEGKTASCNRLVSIGILPAMYAISAALKYSRSVDQNGCWLIDIDFQYET